MSTPKAPKKDCPRHLFTLKPKSHTCHYQDSITLCLCDRDQQKKGLKGDKNKTTKTVAMGACYEGPIFNRDRNYLTSAFVPASEKVWV